MKANVLKIAAALLLAGTVAGCGGGQDAGNSSSSSDARDESALPSAAVRTQESVDDAAGSMDESAETAGNEMENAGDQVGDMAEDAGREAERTANEMGDRAEDMANDAANEGEQMANEASDEAEQAMSDTAGAMSMDDSESAASADSGDPCVVNVEVGDSIAYSLDGISVPSSCDSVTINLEHTGSLPKEGMGHNWVLVPSDAVNDIGTAGMSAGIQNNYVPDDDRIVASTDIIGGGESTSVSFSLDDLEDGVDYTYVCTFPGHWTVMQGPFTVE